MDVVSFAAQVSDRPGVLDPVEHDCYPWCTFETALEMLDWPGRPTCSPNAEQSSSGYALVGTSLLAKTPCTPTAAASSRTGGHGGARAGALVDSCSEAVADRIGSDGLVAAWATGQKPRELVAGFREARF